MGIVIIVAVVVVAAAVAVIVLSRRTPGSAPGSGSVAVEAERDGPTVVDFHVGGGSARVHFDVPLPVGEVDAVLADLLIREAVEVVREKRHTLPLDDVHRVVALGRRADGWAEVGTVELDTPGTLPPPMVPELLPHASRPGFDAFERISDLPDRAPGLADRSGPESLEPIGPQLRLPQAVDAGIRAQGLDPSTTDACDLVLGVMRLAGYRLNERSIDTVDAVSGGQRVFIRTVPHAVGEHPELSEPEVDRFVVDFMSSGADRGLLVTEKFCPFEIYDRERREPRMRFITRERIQGFVDALSVG